MQNECQSKLVIRTRGGYRFEYPLPAGTTTIGRGRDCDLILEDDFASRHHARIELRNGKYVLTDEESRNGTVVRGKPLHGNRNLAHGDEIQIGDTQLLYIEENAEDPTTKELKPLSPQQIQSPIQVDTQTWEVWIEGKKLVEKLSVLEFKLLGVLYANADRIIGRDELCTELWGKDAYTFEMLHQLVHRLKRRIEPNPLTPRYILSVAGVGYRLNTASEDPTREASV